MGFYPSVEYVDEIVSYIGICIIKLCIIAWIIIGTSRMIQQYNVICKQKILYYIKGDLLYYVKKKNFKKCELFIQKENVSIISMLQLIHNNNLQDDEDLYNFFTSSLHFKKMSFNKDSQTKPSIPTIILQMHNLNYIKWMLETVKLIDLDNFIKLYQLHNITPTYNVFLYIFKNSLFAHNYDRLLIHYFIMTPYIFESILASPRIVTLFNLDEIVKNIWKINGQGDVILANRQPTLHKYGLIQERPTYQMLTPNELNRINKIKAMFGSMLGIWNIVSLLAHANVSHSVRLQFVQELSKKNNDYDKTKFKQIEDYTNKWTERKAKLITYEFGGLYSALINIIIQYEFGV